jgi:predicted transcriptional regulator
MEKLIKYLIRTGQRPTQLASTMKVHRNTVDNWKSGRTKPLVDLAIRLEEITNGEISVYDWK